MHNGFPVTSLWEEGIFETMRSSRGKVVALDEHIGRLFESAHALLLSLGTSRKALKRLLEREVASKPYAEATVRVAFFREGKRSRLFLIVKEAKRVPPFCYERGVSIRTSPTQRNLISAIDAQLKTREYLNGLLSMLDSLSSEEESFEEIYLDSDGYMTEGRISNIFIVKEKILSTPPTFLGVLKGITRGHAIDKARQFGFPVQELPFTRANVYGADEVFLTNTSMGVMPVVSVDGRKIGDGKVGKVTTRLMNFFRKKGPGNA